MGKGERRKGGKRGKGENGRESLPQESFQKSATMFAYILYPF